MELVVRRTLVGTKQGTGSEKHFNGKLVTLIKRPTQEIRPSRNVMVNKCFIVAYFDGCKWEPFSGLSCEFTTVLNQAELGYRVFWNSQNSIETKKLAFRHNRFNFSQEV